MLPPAGANGGVDCHCRGHEDMTDVCRNSTAKDLDHQWAGEQDERTCESRRQLASMGTAGTGTRGIRGRASGGPTEGFDGPKHVRQERDGEGKAQGEGDGGRRRGREATWHTCLGAQMIVNLERPTDSHGNRTTGLLVVGREQRRVHAGRRRADKDGAGLIRLIIAIARMGISVGVLWVRGCAGGYGARSCGLRTPYTGQMKIVSRQDWRLAGGERFFDRPSSLVPRHLPPRLRQWVLRDEIGNRKLFPKSMARSELYSKQRDKYSTATYLFAEEVRGSTPRVEMRLARSLATPYGGSFRGDFVRLTQLTVVRGVGFPATSRNARGARLHPRADGVLRRRVARACGAVMAGGAGRVRSGAAGARDGLI
ncbi:hypothetical protein B0H17DRAFT_1138896 [Mycena rosella]|uniref:Uncharacterized protein n=1 Tax=Mycena rosella TaxID=1033263 RepID=A0AAD7D5V5_MYCRO|nr:hypothetical protein B0H17DRAFT_1138896 [Mycena rosella]